MANLKLESYVIDAVALLAYLANNLPKKANDVFIKAESEKCILYLPNIAFGEVLYTIYKGKEIFGKMIPLEKVYLLFQIVQNAQILRLIDMNLAMWRIFDANPVSELHDRMIIATFLYLEAKALITNDSEIEKAVHTIWN